MYRTVGEDYKRALAKAQRALSSLSFARLNRSSPEKVRGLRGWVFEQVLLSRLKKALRRKGIKLRIVQQEPIGGRAAVDFVIGSAAIEAKVSGDYEDSRAKYRRYRKVIEAKGWHYFYVTLEETYEPNVRKAREVFGRNRAFFLDRPKQWSKLIFAIAKIENKRNAQKPQRTRRVLVRPSTRVHG